MRISLSQLRRIIKEEVTRVVNEAGIKKPSFNELIQQWEDQYIGMHGRPPETDEYVEMAGKSYEDLARAVDKFSHEWYYKSRKMEIPPYGE